MTIVAGRENRGVIRRREFLGFVGGAVAWSSTVARAQQIEVLNADRDYYVDTHGVDDPVGGSQVAPFKTITFAVKMGMNVWPNGHYVSIRVNDGTYNEKVEVWSGAAINGRALYFYGNETHPERVVINPGGDN